MSLFARRRVAELAGSEERFFVGPVSPFASMTSAGEEIDFESAMYDVAFGACIRVLKTEVAQLPVHTFTKRGTQRKLVDDPEIVQSPSKVVARRSWVAQVMDALAREGNAYLLITTDSAGAPVSAETLPVGKVEWQHDNGIWSAIVESKPYGLWPHGPLMHITASAFMRAGYPMAMSPSHLGREAIGASIAAARYGANFFGGGGHTNKIIVADQELTTEQAQQIKQSFIAATKTREPAVFGSGLSIEQIQEKPSDADFLNLLRFGVEQACRVTGVPPAMVYAQMTGQNVTYANVTDADLQFLKHSLGIWLGDFEDAWSSLLAGRQFVKFNVDALLRSSPKERHSIYAQRLRFKTMSVNEVRALEDEPPFEGPEWDEPGIPGGEEPVGLGAGNDPTSI